jgi:N-acetylglutamate synthase/N-acetylornithine aminotransferase
VTIGGKPVHIGGMCKGSGMIHPNMATMLGIVTCDAAVEPAVWRDMLRRACEASFNAVRKMATDWVHLHCTAVHQLESTPRRIHSTHAGQTM